MTYIELEYEIVDVPKISVQKGACFDASTGSATMLRHFDASMLRRAQQP